MANVYVSAVEGRVVARYPSFRMPVTQYIGAERFGKVIKWNPDAVIAIGEDEWRRYRREYQMAVNDGSLVLRTEKDFASWVKASEASTKTASVTAQTVDEGASK